MREALPLRNCKHYTILSRSQKNIKYAHDKRAKYVKGDLWLHAWLLKHVLCLHGCAHIAQASCLRILYISFSEESPPSPVV